MIAKANSKKPEAAQCLTPGCDKKAAFRGKTTWEEMERLGLVLARRRPGGPFVAAFHRANGTKPARIKPAADAGASKSAK